MGKVAFFGGSFDPPHHGHIHLILSLMEAHHIDTVLIIPTQQNPLKPCVASPVQRFTMARHAFEEIKGCSVLEVELNRPPPSYTIDTLRWLMKEMALFRDNERFLLLGADVIPSLPQWRDVDQVLTIAHPLFAARGGFDMGLLDDLPYPIVQAVRDGWTDTGFFDISSTTIRERVCKGLYVDHLVPDAVLRYIHSEQLYL